MLVMHVEQPHNFTSIKRNKLSPTQKSFVSKSSLEYQGLKCFSFTSLNLTLNIQYRQLSFFIQSALLVSYHHFL